MLKACLFSVFFLFESVLSQTLKELPQPSGLQAKFNEKEINLSWEIRGKADSLSFNVYRSVVFDPENIHFDLLSFKKVKNTTDEFYKEIFRDTKNIGHLAFIYFVTALDSTGLESVRSNYFFVNLKE